MAPIENRYLVVDDEPIAHRIIDDYCRALPHLVLARHAFDAMQAMGYMASEPIDLLFLDLAMPKLTGFEFLRGMPIHCPVIVTTAHQEFALEGYELRVCDYLLKPFGFERFVKAVNRALPPPAQARIDRPPHSGAIVEPPPRTIFVKGDRKHHQVALADIRYIEACGNYCVLRSSEGSVITAQTMSGFERELPPDQFMRVHKSYLVAIGRISSIGSNSLMIGGDQLPIGPSYRKQVFSRLRLDRPNA